jgi:hypothetical protein
MTHCPYHQAPLSVDAAQPPDDSERTGTCDRKRFLEAMALDDSAGESSNAYRTLCEPRPNA